ncbi:MAG: flagellar hook-associated protein FlgK [Desulfovibrionaceae bacterium]|nr:flagellar hook-associated protein FlgK [Desulfovibrionaceae bacterium]
MAWGVNSVLSMGVGALFASQANIQTTGNNISNVNTPGYSRQVVRQEERQPINGRPGQVGQGVIATEVIRYFDAFLESNYLDKLSTSQRYEAQYKQMRYVDNVFNESNLDGLSSSITGLFMAWNKLAQKPNDLPTREALLAQAGILATAVNNADDTLRRLEEQMNTMIAQDVATANQLMQEIAFLNREISANYTAGRNNPNELMDKRDAKVRELASIIDVDVDDRGPGAYQIRMKNGYTLVQNDVPFSLKFGDPRAENNLQANSPYKAQNPDGSTKTIQFAGRDSHEYTVQIVDGGSIDGGATFKVSIDGGRTWLTDDNGQVRIFDAKTEGGSQRVGELDIWFDAGDILAGDRFVISPKKDVYWVSPTAGPINVSTQVFLDGTDNRDRIVGGSLGGLIEFRDYRIGEYRDRLKALTQSLAWEVNRIHTQGAGLTPMNNALGTYSVGRDTAPLGSPESLFSWSDRLQTGNMTFAIFRSDGSPYIPYPGLEVFSPNNFDPSVHSLQDVAAAINAATFTDGDGIVHQPFTARIVDGHLHISSSDPDRYSFAITDDTSGLAAALGINTFFTGDDPASFGVRPDLSTNLNLINAGQVNVPGELNMGDNQIAKQIADLANKAVDIGTIWNKKTSQPISAYYSTLVTKVGSDTASVKFTAANETAMALDLYVRCEEVSGVSLDEEMSSLIKFQASYKAAAKLITTADEMLQTLLGLKQ